MMQATQLKTALIAITGEVGIASCALVDASTGLVWCAIGQLEHTPLIAEAACDYWRVYLRNREYFQDMGDMRAQVLIHSKQRLTILGIEPSLLLISLTDEKSHINWGLWQAKVRHFQNLVLSS